MNVDTASVEEIVIEIFDSMLGLGIGPAAPAPEDGRREIGSAVQITGSWQGAFILECPETSAVAFTQAMLGYEADEAPSETEIHDVIGELANVAGGNLKALVGGESNLSLPTVVAGSGLDLSVLGASEIVRSHYTAGGEPFTVAVVARSQ